MNEHTVIEHLGNLGVILLAVLLSTSVHYLFLKHLNQGARLAKRFPQIRLGYGVIVSLVAHSIEVALFAFAYKVSIASGFGALEGTLRARLPTTFTSPTQRSPPLVSAILCRRGLCDCWQVWKRSQALC